MSQETQGAKSTFKITKSLIEGYHKKGYTVKEMADKISETSGNKCSVGTVNKAANLYSIDMQKKPRKNGFEFEEIVAAPVAQNPEELEDTVVNRGFQF